MKAIVTGFFAAAMLSATSAMACTDWELPPTYGEATLSAGFTPDPHAIQMAAGGPVSLVDCRNEPGAGFISEAPDYDLYWEGNGQLTIAFEASEDTVLIVNGPDYEWYYNDDYKGVNPAIVIPNAGPGLYDIWVGTIAPDSYPEGQLIITELPY
ncbi:peptidase domain-containing protein [Ketogulonicigenium robustum]|uniref:Peptidase domain-containing protein n=1 Tax=Ketogulonicigenium robustum TaxID=92947 RepID=A0A1W6NZ96_9RHOB|nr:peptidase S1 [Ketogulonicigenium robustum]ARO14524.1 peptidase domain-containing protein [Ketogulonicigenium robustum]